jgi:hypothetical protein
MRTQVSRAERKTEACTRSVDAVYPNDLVKLAPPPDLEAKLGSQAGRQVLDAGLDLKRRVGLAGDAAGKGRQGLALGEAAVPLGPAEEELVDGDIGGDLVGEPVDVGGAGEAHDCGVVGEGTGGWEKGNTDGSVGGQPYVLDVHELCSREACGRLTSHRWECVNVENAA